MFLMPGLVITCYTTGCLDTVLGWVQAGGWPSMAA